MNTPPNGLLIDCLEWRAESADLFSATLMVRAGTMQAGRRFIVVERLPDGGWDWTTWMAQGARQRGPVLQGRASSVIPAMNAACRAAGVAAGAHLTSSRRPPWPGVRLDACHRGA